MSATFDRRVFLRRAGLLGAGTVALMSGLPRPPARADESLAPFLHGVASGDPLADRVILWTRVTTEARRLPVRWTVARDVELTDVVASGTVDATAAADHTVKVDASGLEPGTWYFYGFEAMGKRSLVGRTKTAPAAGVEHLRFGVVSCSNYPAGYFNAYALLAERNDLDAILHLGDYVYEYGNGEYGELRDVEPPHEMATLADYRTRYAHYRLDPDLRRLHQLYPFVTVWDDHESTNDSWSGGAENHGDGDVEGDDRPWEERKADSQQAYAEWLPIRTDDPARIYRTLPGGDLLDLVMLDTRLEGRDEQVSGPAEGAPVDFTLILTETEDPERELISQAQRDHLFGALSASTATWRIVGQQVMVMPWNAGGLPDFDDDLPDFPSLIRSGGNALNADAWDGYVAERERLYAHLEDNAIDNVVVLTGDVHTSWAADLPEDPYDPTVYDPITGDGSLAVEFVTPSVTSENLNEIGGYPEGGSAPLEAATLADNPHVKFVDYDRHGYVVLDVTPDRVQADWWFTATHLEPSMEQSYGAGWVVEDGQNHVVAASGPVADRADVPAAPPAEVAGAPGGGPDDGPAGAPPPVEAAPATPALPATGGGLALKGAAALGAAGLLEVVRRRDGRRRGEA